MPGFDNDIVYARNVDFTGNSLVKGTPQIISNGQLLIGSATGTNGPCLLAGSLTSSDNSITVTNGSGTISLTVTGGSSVGKTITGNSGGAISPSLGNWNILGSGSITTIGTGNTLTVQVTGLTNHAVLVGAGSDTITKIAATANTGAILQNNSGADPSYSTATYPSVGTSTGSILRADGTNWVATTATYPNTIAAGKLLYGTSTNVVGAVTFSIVIQKFLTSGTYTATSGAVQVIIECVGGGGAGGGTSSSLGGDGAGGGGGAGSYSRKTTTAAAATGATVTVGAGGTGVSGGTGNNGGDTSVGALCVGKGGSGGTTGSNSGGGGGGAGGVAGTGDYTGIGAAGFNGGYATISTVSLTSGAGGVSPFGGGASGVYGANSTVTGSAAAANSGSGGSGSSINNSASSGTGGAGGSGLVIITEYVLS